MKKKVKLNLIFDRVFEMVSNLQIAEIVAINAGLIFNSQHKKRRVTLVRVVFGVIGMTDLYLYPFDCQ